MSSATPPTEYFPGINFNPSFYNLGQSAVTLDYLNSNFLRSTGYAISRAQFTLFNGSVDINENLDVSGNINASAYLVNNVPVSFSQWTTTGNDIYYNTVNVGIGKRKDNIAYLHFLHELIRRHNPAVYISFWRPHEVTRHFVLVGLILVDPPILTAHQMNVRSRFSQ